MKFTANNENERTRFTILQTFCDDEHDYVDDVTIYVPFEIVVKVIETFVRDAYDVEVSGKQTAVWNLFEGTGFIDSLFEDDDFIEAVTQAYRNSVYPEMDYNEWVESEPWED